MIFNVSQTKRGDLVSWIWLRGVTKSILQNHSRNTVLDPGSVMAELSHIYTSKAEKRPYPWHGVGSPFSLQIVHKMDKNYLEQHILRDKNNVENGMH